jgi:DNA-binding transcriptional LysR family regulator
MSIEIRLLQAAIALAEELNYSKAAERLHITQSALTKQIHELENALPLVLFERDKKHVALLHPGDVFVEEARLAVMHGERAVYLAKAAASEESRTVVIGRSPYADAHLVDSLFAVTLPCGFGEPPKNLYGVYDRSTLFLSCIVPAFDGLD